jgi:uncharacterized membrane protein
LVVKCLKHKDHTRFLEEGYKIVIVVAPFPKRMLVELYCFLFDLENCQMSFIILNFVNVMRCQVGGWRAKRFYLLVFANICTTSCYLHTLDNISPVIGHRIFTCICLTRITLDTLCTDMARLSVVVSEGLLNAVWFDWVEWGMEGRGIDYVIRPSPTPSAF